MNPEYFPESNATYGHPKNLDESQVLGIRAYEGVVNQGNLDGHPFVVVAWKPTPEDIKKFRKVV